jgi:hypothetical protein
LPRSEKTSLVTITAAGKSGGKLRASAIGGHPWPSGDAVLRTEPLVTGISATDFRGGALPRSEPLVTVTTVAVPQMSGKLNKASMGG